MYQNHSIVATLDYSAFLQGQYSEAKKDKQGLGFIKKINFSFLDFCVNHLITRVNKRLTKQLLSAKGLYAELSGQVEDIDQQKLPEAIDSIDKMILIYADMVAFTQKTISQSPPSHIDSLSQSSAILAETIEVFYDILRLLKKVHKVIPVGDKELARKASIYSANSLKKVAYGR